MAEETLNDTVGGLDSGIFTFLMLFLVLFLLLFIVSVCYVFTMRQAFAKLQTLIREHTAAQRDLSLQSLSTRQGFMGNHLPSSNGNGHRCSGNGISGHGNSSNSNNGNRSNGFTHGNGIGGENGSVPGPVEAGVVGF
ncbi:hypothetical protein MPH_04026 [Macrophomina phaseolina MS6]|uniref:Uncharacterized protein n=1 Tax=Macrophomina phaseolina (strain MS6) TaxID=1126212 RepID=K2SPI1_MACPH|nr:hypothetical protein MPH_04026 [Macrophomina phaseolina MS6]